MKSSKLRLSRANMVVSLDAHIFNVATALCAYIV